MPKREGLFQVLFKAQQDSKGLIPRSNLNLVWNFQVNFKFERSLRVYNELRIAADGAGPPDAFTTDFKFSTKAALIVGMTNAETAADLVDKIRDKFNILEEGKGGEMRLFEREISVRQQDVFYRRLGDQACVLLNGTNRLCEIPNWVQPRTIDLRGCNRVTIKVYLQGDNSGR